MSRVCALRRVRFATTTCAVWQRLAALFLPLGAQQAGSLGARASHGCKTCAIAALQPLLCVCWRSQSLAELGPVRH